jgi:hypothetical protein
MFDIWLPNPLIFLHPVWRFRVTATDELGDLLDHFFLDAGVAVLGKWSAGIGCHRMTK